MSERVNEAAKLIEEIRDYLEVFDGHNFNGTTKEELCFVIGKTLANIYVIQSLLPERLAK